MWTSGCLGVEICGIPPRARLMILGVQWLTRPCCIDSNAASVFREGAETNKIPALR